jgi:hypothetical protein
MHNKLDCFGASDIPKALNCLDFMQDLMPPKAERIVRSLLLLLSEDSDELDYIGKMLNIDPPVAFKIFVLILMSRNQEIAGTLFDQVFVWIQEKYLPNMPELMKTFNNRLFSLCCQIKGKKLDTNQLAKEMGISSKSYNDAVNLLLEIHG